LVSLGTIEGFDYSAVTAIHKRTDKDAYLIGTNGNGLFTLVISEEGNALKRLNDNEELEYLNVQSIFGDSDNNCWISTNESGVLRLRLSEEDGSPESIRFFNKDSGLPGNNAKLVFQDVEGNFWIGLFGDGLSMLPTLAFTFYAPGLTPGDNNILYINKIADDYFLGTPTGYYLFNLENNK